MIGSSRKRIMKLDSQQRKGLSLISKLRPKSFVAEQYRTIRTNIQFSMIDRDVKSIVMTSSGPWEGKSTTAANLASVFTDQGKRVLLVDADLRKPSVQRTFGLSNVEGLTTLLSTPDQELSEVIQQVTGTDIHVLTSGPIPPNPSELLNSNRMNLLMKRLEEIYDIIIYDMPPVTSVTDAQIMAAKSDGVVFVIRHSVSQKSAILNAKELLEMVNANILGVVFNGVVKKTDQFYYGYGYIGEGEA